MGLISSLNPAWPQVHQAAKKALKFGPGEDWREFRVGLDASAQLGIRVYCLTKQDGNAARTFAANLIAPGSVELTVFFGHGHTASQELGCVQIW